MIKRFKNARTDLEVISKKWGDTTVDTETGIIRGIITIGDDCIEFYIDNEKKYGRLWEYKKGTTTQVNLDITEMEEGGN